MAANKAREDAAVSERIEKFKAFKTQVDSSLLPEGMKKMSVAQVDSVFYGNEVDTVDIAGQFRMIKELKLREDDVICVGYPRTGNNWMFEVVTMALNQEVSYQKEHFYFHIMEFMGTDIQEKIDFWKSPRVLSSHARLNKLPREVVEKGVKVIYLLRNPKDVWYSMYKLYSTTRSDHDRFTGSWEQFFDISMKGDFIYGYYLDHLLDAEKFIQENPKNPVFLRSFEKSVLDPVDEVRKLCSFLGKPDTLAAEIAKATTFSAMQKGTEEKMEHVRRVYYKEGESGLMRHGVIGDWKKHFTVEQSEAFDRLFHEKMARSKIADFIKDFL